MMSKPQKKNFENPNTRLFECLSSEWMKSFMSFDIFCFSKCFKVKIKKKKEHHLLYIR